MAMSGSPKSPYPSANDPDHRSFGARYISAATNGFPPTQMLEKHFAVSPTEAEHPRFNPVRIHLCMEVAFIQREGGAKH